MSVMTSPTSLHDIRVIDLSRVLAGPWATQLLGDLGAEIIKIEKPIVGDDTRHWGPPYIQTGVDKKGRTAAYNLCTNRNKKSVTLDFTHPEGKQVLIQLIKESDVLVENYKLGTLKRFGLDYDAIKAVNPRLIYCSITGFGQTGPWAARAGYDFLIQGLGGLMSLTGRPDDQPGGGPLKVGVALADIMTGMYASTAILAALHHRTESGSGQYIDMALLDTQVAVLANQAMNYFHTGENPERLGNAHPNVVPYQDFKTADGHIIIAVGNDDQFKKLMNEIDLPELSHDPDFESNEARNKNREHLIPLIAEKIKNHQSSDWIERFEQIGVPCGPINSLEEVFNNEQVASRGMQIEMSHENYGAVPLVANPINLSETPIQYNYAPPELGEHTRTVLSELCELSEDEIQKLANKRVI